MKPGDLIHMPGETVREGDAPSVGIVIDVEPRHSRDKRVGVLWANWNQVEWDPSHPGVQSLSKWPVI